MPNAQSPFPIAILAGGLATRMRPLTDRLPKSMLDVNGEPFINHQLRLLRKSGLRRVLLCVGTFGEMIQAHVGDGARFEMDVAYSFDGDALLGTGGAIRKAAALLSDTFFITYGDSYLACDYCAIQNTFISSGKPALMTVFRNEGRWDGSNVEFREGRIIAYDKRAPNPRMSHIDYGLAILTRSALDLMADQIAFDLADLYRALVARGEMAAYEVQDRFYEIGGQEGLEETRQYLSNQETSTESS
jgi:NDP-sugar pyrophosphorylase family protein